MNQGDSAIDRDQSGDCSEVLLKAMQRLLKMIGVVSIVALTLMAAVAESSAQTGNNTEDDYNLCLKALNRKQTAWDKDGPTFSKDVAEAIRRGLTVDRCRQLVKPTPATDSGRSGWIILLIVALSVGVVGYFSWPRRQSTKYPSAIPNPAIVLERDSYSNTARTIDVVAFLVLASGLFVPIARVGFRMKHLVDTDGALIFAGAALAGLVAALARYRRIVVISAVVYGALFASLVVNYQQALSTMRAELKDNLLGGLAEALVGLEWGCAVITFAVLSVLCSTIFVRRIYQP